MAEQRMNIVPVKGERALITGSTGSGKTSFAVHLLKCIEDAPAIIYDTKIEPKFENLPHSVVVQTMDEVHPTIEKGEHDYVIVRPPIELLSHPLELDKMLQFHYLHLQGLPAYIDEAYTFHNGGRAGPGLVGLLTRGRSKGITTIISTQRPVWLSRFCITEAQKLFVFHLLSKDDRKSIDAVVEDYSKLPNPKNHYFNYIDFASMDKPQLFAPVKLDEIANSSYTDEAGTTAEPTRSASIWI